MPLANVETGLKARGCAQLTVEHVSGQSAVTSAYARAPLKLLTPRARGQSAWVYTSSFGGGFVAGDETRLDLRLGSGARCFLGTQASTKIYRNPRRLACGHVTQAVIEENSLLVFAPDPVQPFAESSYFQHQEFRLGAGSGLVLLDWFTSGRAARGERWAFNRLQSRNDVFLSGERVFMDSLRLDAAGQPVASAHRTGRYNCFALLLLLGAPLQAAATDLLAALAASPVKRGAALIASASPVPHGAMLRVAGESVESVGRALHSHLKFASALLGDDPWARKW
ncbi:MAG TPA: urease accessory protein UreD [Verrucomicrobiae bacterium]|nr:urease accessory protein UreD [Verrucomicrobiae bacterium]